MKDCVELDINSWAVATITLVGSDDLNRFDLAMRDELIEALWAVERHPDVRAVVIRSGRRHFSAGADLRQFGTADSVFEARRIRWDRDPWTPLAELSKPTVAALHGNVMGSGLEMAMLCDLRIATDSTRFALPEIRLGMLPAAGGTQSAPRLTGVSRALPFVLRGGTIDTGMAVSMGLINEVVTDAHARAAEIARDIAVLPADAVRALLAALRVAADRPLISGLALERHLGRQPAGSHLAPVWR